MIIKRKKCWNRFGGFIAIYKNEEIVNCIIMKEVEEVVTGNPLSNHWSLDELVNYDWDTTMMFTWEEKKCWDRFRSFIAIWVPFTEVQWPEVLHFTRNNICYLFVTLTASTGPGRFCSLLNGSYRSIFGPFAETDPNGSDNIAARTGTDCLNWWKQWKDSFGSACLYV